MKLFNLQVELMQKKQMDFNFKLIDEKNFL